MDKIDLPPRYVTIGPIHWKCVCESHPEEWEAYHGHEEVGFVQLAEEILKVHSPNQFGQVIYGATLDFSKHGYGVFFKQIYRHQFLHHAAIAICASHGIPFHHQEGSRKWPGQNNSNPSQKQ